MVDSISIDDISVLMDNNWLFWDTCHCVIALHWYLGVAVPHIVSAYPQLGHCCFLFFNLYILLLYSDAFLVGVLSQVEVLCFNLVCLDSGSIPADTGHNFIELWVQSHINRVLTGSSLHTSYCFFLKRIYVSVSLNVLSMFVLTDYI